MIDVFLELPILNKGQKISDIEIKSKSSLYKFMKNQKGCLELEKKCQYPNIRFHNTDIRKVRNNLPFIVILSQVINQLYYNIEEKNLEMYKNHIILVLDILMIHYKKDVKEYSKIKTHEQLLEYLMEIYSKFKFSKQYNHISDEEVKSILIKNLLESLKKIDLKIISYYHILKLMSNIPLSKFPNEQTIKNINILSDNFQLLMAPLMDTYLLARIFRKFKKVEYQNSNQPENIIIYVGNYHANIYRNILDKLNFKTQFSTNSNEGEFCVNISNLKQPLFKFDSQ